MTWKAAVYLLLALFIIGCSDSTGPGDPAPHVELDVAESGDTVTFIAGVFILDTLRSDVTRPGGDHDTLFHRLDGRRLGPTPAQIFRQGWTIRNRKEVVIEPGGNYDPETTKWEFTWTGWIISDTVMLIWTN